MVLNISVYRRRSVPAGFAARESGNARTAESPEESRHTPGRCSQQPEFRFPTRFLKAAAYPEIN
jgi:hypothetical protein